MGNFSLSTASEVKMKNENGDSWIAITNPSDGSSVRLPFAITVNASNDVDMVKYNIDGFGSVNWEVEERPDFEFNVHKFLIFNEFFDGDRDKILKRGDTITLKALGYDYEETPHESGYTLIAESEIISVTIQSGFSIQSNNNLLFGMIQKFFSKILF